MKIITLICLLHGVFITVNAQQKIDHQQFLKSRVGQVPVSLPGKKTSPSPVTAFEVVDYRSDTTRLGFWAENRSRREFVFKTNVRETIQSYLNNFHAAAAGENSYLVILKKLWLYDEKNRVDGPGYGRMLFRAEAFLKTSEGLVPYTYIDTLFKSKFSNKGAPGSRIAEALTLLAEKIAATNEPAVKRPFTYRQLDSLNTIRFAYNMDTAVDLKEGVYANVTEFRNNAPSVTNYEIAKDENGLPQLYVKDEKGNSYYSHTMFGYCDGQQAYAMMNGNFFPILFIDHAFYVWGSKEFKVKTKKLPVIIPIGPLAVFGMMDMSQTAVRAMRFFSLDVYSGEIY